jgi:hypothetical protein
VRFQPTEQSRLRASNTRPLHVDRLEPEPVLLDTRVKAMIVAEGVRELPAARRPDSRVEPSISSQGNPVAQTARDLGSVSPAWASDEKWANATVALQSSQRGTTFGH